MDSALCDALSDPELRTGLEALAATWREGDTRRGERAAKVEGAMLPEDLVGDFDDVIFGLSKIEIILGIIFLYCL